MKEILEVMTDELTLQLYHVTNRYAAEIIVRRQQFKPSDSGLLGPGYYFWESLVGARSYVGEHVEGGVTILKAQVMLGPDAIHRITGEHVWERRCEPLRRCQVAACGKRGSGMHGDWLHPVPFNEEAWAQMSFPQQAFAEQQCPTCRQDRQNLEQTFFRENEDEFKSWRDEGFAAAQYTSGLLGAWAGDGYGVLQCAACAGYPCRDECGARDYASTAPARSEFCIVNAQHIGRISMVEHFGLSCGSAASVAEAFGQTCQWLDMAPSARSAVVEAFRKAELELLPAADEALACGHAAEVREVLGRIGAITGANCTYDYPGPCAFRDERTAWLEAGASALECLAEAEEALEQRSQKAVRMVRNAIRFCEESESPSYFDTSRRRAQLAAAADALEHEFEEKIDKELEGLSAALAALRASKLQLAEERLAAAGEALEVAVASSGADRKAAGKEYGAHLAATKAVDTLKQELKKVDAVLERRDVAAARKLIERLAR